MSKRLKIKTKNFRGLAATVRAADISEDGIVTFPFSSEVPVERYWGTEVLSHDKKAMNLERLSNGAPLLFNHDWDKQIGVVVKAWVEDKRGFCQVKFSKNPFAQEKLVDVRDGILTGVSFGYEIKKMKLDTQKDGVDTYVVTDYQPFEISMVTVPADISVGVGRSQDNDPENEIEIEVDEPVADPVTDPAPAATVEPAGNPAPVLDNSVQQRSMNPNPTLTTKKGEQMDPVEKERQRMLHIAKLGQQYGLADLARQLQENGTTLEDANALFLEKVGSRQTPLTGKEGMLDLSQAEINKYSFLRAVQALMNPSDHRAQEAAKFEREISIAASQKAGKQAQGFYIPPDILAQKRDMTVGTAADGGNLVATNLQDSFIEILRKKSAVQRAGATTLNGLVGNISWSRQNGATTAYHPAEGAAATESNPTFDQVSMSPKTISAFVDYSRKLALQSSFDVEQLLRGDLAQVLALGIDYQALYGAGGNYPTGLVGITGLNIVDFGVAAQPTWAEIVQLESEVAGDDGDVDMMKYICGAAMRGYLKSTPKVAGTSVMMMDGSEINGYDAIISNQVTAGQIFMGVWNQLILGFWSGVDITVDPFTGSKEGNVRIVAHQDYDVAAKHGQSFAKGVLVP